MFNYAGYKEWKEDYDKQQEEMKHSRNALFEQIQTNKRKADTELAMKKKKVKRRASYDSDESNGSNNYKDKRVFDSDEDSDVEISNDLTGDKRKVFEFFQTATVNELQLMSSCSKKKAEGIVELRPYKGWIDLVCIHV